MNQVELNQFIEASLQEDLQYGDVTSLACIKESQRSEAHLKVKEDGVIAGIEVAEAIFRYVDPEIIFEPLIKDGAIIHEGDIAFLVKGNTRNLLKTERLVLNIMQRMSGIASLSNRFHMEVADLPVGLLDTRKTTPLFRHFEKWAVRIGGCLNYRFGLYDRFMIKDNHIKACGSVSKAVESVHRYAEQNNLQQLEITIEVKNLIELEEVLSCNGIHQIMMDNFEMALLREAVAMVDKKSKTEASGGVCLETVRTIALTGVDYISIGALTHSAGSLDLSLKILG